MKKLLLILLCLPFIGFGQNVNIPDANFKAYLVGEPSINTNGDSEIQVGEAIVFNGTINCYNLNIYDLTGIEYFSNLTNLSCGNNLLTSLDVSNNTALTYLFCDNNQLTSLNVSINTSLTTLRCMNNQLTSLDVSYNANLDWLSCSNNQLTSLDVSYNANLDWLSCSNNQLTSLNVSANIALTKLWCNDNQLTSLDVSANTALTDFQCHSNQLTSLDVSNNTALTYFSCDSNQLTSLDLRNGNNTNLSYYVFSSTGNPSLNCISVDDDAWSTANWTVANGNIDPHQYFSNNCAGTAIQEHHSNKELLKVTDLLGREAKQNNQPLFYIYDDGTIEKRIVIE